MSAPSPSTRSETFFVPIGTNWLIILLNSNLTYLYIIVIYSLTGYTINQSDFSNIDNLICYVNVIVGGWLSQHSQPIPYSSVFLYTTIIQSKIIYNEHFKQNI